MTTAPMRGLVIGLVLGIVWMWLGFGAALLTGVLGALGYVIGVVIQNLAARHLNFADLWNDLQGRRAGA